MAAPTIAQKPSSENIERRTLAIPVWLRNPAGVALIIAAVFGVIGTLTVALEIGRPFGRFAAYGYFERTTSDLAYETPQWWSPIAYGFLQYGDQILTINGQPFTPNAWTEMAAAHERGEQIELEIRRPGVEAPSSVLLPTTTFSFWDFLDLKLPEIVVGIVFCLVAAIVLRARPDLMTNRVFATLAAFVAVHRLTAVTSLTVDTAWLINLPRVVHMFAAGLIGPLTVHMAFLFPTPLMRQPRKTLIALYGLGLFSGVILALSRTSWWLLLPQPVIEILDFIAYRTMLFLLLIGIVVLFGRLALSWFNRRNVSQRERLIVRIVFFGLLISMPPIFTMLRPLIPGGQEQVAFFQGLDIRYFMLAIPIAFAIAIVRYQTFQSPSPLFITVIALSMSALLADVGVALWLNSLPAERISAVRPPFPEAFAFILIASLFWSRQADWRGWFGRFLNRADRNYESARSFGHRVMGRKDIRAMPETMAQALVDELELERAAVWLWRAEAGVYELAASAGSTEPPIPSQLTPPPVHPPVGRIQPVSWPSTPAWLRDPADAARIEVLICLEHEGRPVGMLGLGRRWDEEIFDERDLAVIELVGQQASLFIQAAIQIEELRLVPERVAAAQEQERYKLAAELHDTIQQFLGRLPFFLTVSQEKILDDPEEAAAILDRCMTDVEEASVVLREIRANLAPNQLEFSLTKPLEGLAAYVKKQSGLSVRLDIPDDLDEATTTSTRHALYRVFRQATDNAIAHAEASEVVIALRREDGRILFSVSDNGRGSTEDYRSLAIARGSFGLQSMRARVETVGGEFDFISAEGHGTTVSGWVPAAGN